MAFLIFPPYGMDDCYITYRYAYNLFHHHQFVFNLGEKILGTTSPLYTIILTIAQVFSDNIPLMSNLISCVCSALAGFLLFLILKKDGAMLEAKMYGNHGKNDILHLFRYEELI